MKLLAVVAAFASLAAACAPRAEPGRPSEPAEAPVVAPGAASRTADAGVDEAREDTLERVVVIGSSLSGGFGLDVTFDEVLTTMLAPEHELAGAKSNVLFYLAPLDEGRAQIEYALERDPTLLVAVDFLFWFGYGAATLDGRMLIADSQRLDMLETGLALLGRFDCPIVVGDFPDMSDAVATNMLHPRQVPSPAALERLNGRLAAWAEERGDVYVVPISTIIRDMRAGRPFELGGNRWPADSAHRVLQDDQLHPTIEGMAGVASQIARELVADGRSEPGDWQLDLAVVLDELGEVWGGDE